MRLRPEDVSIVEDEYAPKFLVRVSVPGRRIIFAYVYAANDARALRGLLIGSGVGSAE